MKEFIFNKIICFLQSTSRPATLNDIIDHINAETGNYINSVEDCVIEALKTGIRHGYIRKHLWTYSLSKGEYDKCKNNTPKEAKITVEDSLLCRKHSKRLSVRRSTRLKFHPHRRLLTLIKK